MRPTALMLAPVLLLAVAGCTPSPPTEIEANKRLIRDFADVLNAADWDALGAIVADSFARHSAATAGPPVRSRDDFIRLQESFLVSVPDQRVTLQQLVAEGDLVAGLATYSGTQTGPIGDLPATGKTFEVPFLSIFRIESGRIAELWVEWDNVAMLTQLGLFPPPPPGGA